MALYDVSTSEKKASPELVAGGTLYASAPIGTIFATMSASAPSGFLMCDGTAYSATDYPELWAILPSTVKDTTNNTFTIDLRETTLKGAGLTGETVGAHVSTNGLSVGEFLDDRIQTHVHGSYNYNSTSSTTIPSSPTVDGTKGYTRDGSNTYIMDVYRARTGATTEVKSRGVNYIIKAKMVGVPADFLAKVDEAVSDAITVKKGTWSGNITLQKMGDSQTRDRFSIPVTFDTPMPDDNYTVVIEFYESRYVTIRSASKTASGFNIEGANTDNNATSTLTKVNWTAIRFPS